MDIHLIYRGVDERDLGIKIFRVERPGERISNHEDGNESVLYIHDTTGSQSYGNVNGKR